MSDPTTGRALGGGEHDIEFPAMGSDFRLLIGHAAAGGPPARTAELVREFLSRFEVRLSRFRPGSELCRLNSAPRDDVAASPLLRAAVRAGLWAAERTGGLVDPTLVEALEAAGYDRTRRGPELSLAIALAHAPARRPATPDPAARWRAFWVDDARGAIRRPQGLRFDTGGTGKGLAADLVAARLAEHDRWAIDCGGDLRLGGPYGRPAAEPFTVEIQHPLTGERAHSLRLRAGAVATSGLDVRLWRRPDGAPAHHLLDPASREPAWTGLVGATALAPTALEAESLAKAALLSGPRGALRWLSRHGGLVVRDDGEVELCGPLRAHPVVRLPRPVAVRAPAA